MPTNPINFFKSLHNKIWSAVLNYIMANLDDLNRIMGINSSVWGAISIAQIALIRITHQPKEANDTNI